MDWLSALLNSQPFIALLRPDATTSARDPSLKYDRFKLDRMLDAYDTFGRAANAQALKVIVEA